MEYITFGNYRRTPKDISEGRTSTFSWVNPDDPAYDMRNRANRGEFDDQLRTSYFNTEWPQWQKDRWSKVTGQPIPTDSDITASQSGYGDIQGDYYKNIESALKGELPEDVKNQISTAAAEYGIATGMPGSQLAGYAGLRNLGLTSLDLMKWATQAYQPTLQNQFNLNAMQAQSNLDYQNWLNKYNIQLQEQRRQEAAQNWNRSKMGGGTPPIVQRGAGAPAAPKGYGSTGGGYGSPIGGYGTGYGLGTFGTPPPTSNQAVMQSIMDEYGPQTSSNYGTQTDYGMPASSAANYAALAGGTAAGMMGGFGALGGLAGLMGATEGMTGYQNPYQGTAGGWGDENAEFWIPQE